MHMFLFLLFRKQIFMKAIEKKNSIKILTIYKTKSKILTLFENE